MPNNQSEEYLMLFSIGPVQEFIAQARRTRDLWFGSHLLSELSKEGARTFENLGGRLVYPVLSTNNRGESVQTSAPNKILGEIKNDDPKEIARRVRRAITAKWKLYAEETRKKVDSYINIGTWNRQVGDLVEFYASWINMKETEQSEQFKKSAKSVYYYALDKAETLLAARKLLRDFKQNDPGVMYGEKKSSLDGGRESVWRAQEEHQFQLARFGVQEGEALDAISVIKRLSLRLHPEQESFSSVCETAFLPYKDLIKRDAALRGAVDVYLRQVITLLGRTERLDNLSSSADLHGEARLFYPRRIEDYLNETVQGTPEQIQDWQMCIAAYLENLYQGKYSEGKLKGSSLPRPTPYYAFLIADGDHMGKQLRSIDDIVGHITFSGALSDFCMAAVKIMKNHKGELVYGGGDDILAYLPIHCCLEAAKELRECFMEIMGHALPTLSIGIVIAHMLEPLEEVRQMAQEAEKLAKETRNALAVYFHKRGGNDSMKVAFSFEDDPVQQMQMIRCWMSKPFFSVKFAYGLRELYRTYMEMRQDSEWLNDTESLGKLIWMEIGRLARKKKPEGIPAEEIEEWIEDALKPLYKPGDRPLEKLKELSEQFIVTIQLEQLGGHYEETAANTTS